MTASCRTAVPSMSLPKWKKSAASFMWASHAPKINFIYCAPFNAADAACLKQPTHRVFWKTFPQIYWLEKHARDVPRVHFPPLKVFTEPQAHPNQDGRFPLRVRPGLLLLRSAVNSALETRVKHPSWGEGMVLESKIQDNDEIVVIEFKSVGLKRLAASLANLEII